MSNYQFTPTGKDAELWAIAQKRASFKRHMASYLMINIFLWALWYFTNNDHSTNFQYNIPWPIWTTLGWGFGLATHFSKAYIFPKSNATEREYQKLLHKH